MARVCGVPCLQNILRTQSLLGKSYDLVTAVAEYLAVLEQNVDDDNLDEAAQALETLVEVRRRSAGRSAGRVQQGVFSRAFRCPILLSIPVL